MSPLRDSSNARINSTPSNNDCFKSTQWRCGREKALLATALSQNPNVRSHPQWHYRLGIHCPTFHLTLVQIILIVLGALCATCEATAYRGQFLEKSDFARYARRGEILVDRRPAPRVDRPLNVRQGGGDLFDSTSIPSSTVATASSNTDRPFTTASAVSSVVIISPSSSNAPSQTSSLMTAISSATASPLPKPFDTSLGNNFTSTSCPKFFDAFLNNSTFSSCLPFSLLLQNSNSFFVAEHSPIRITQTLDATCQANFDTCNSLMGTLSQQLRDNANCGQDYMAENPLVLQAYAGLISYGPMYQAGCQKDGNGNYCFANAITNTSSPTDSYVYYLPLGIPLPGGSRPTCSSCLQNTMAIFNQAASNMSQPVSNVYTSAAEQIDLGCGPTFANTTIAPIKGSARSGASSIHTIPSIGSLLVVLMVVLGQFL